MAKVENKEAKLDNTMANIYDEKTKEMSLDSTDFIKMNQSHSALSRDNDTDKKIDTQIADSYWMTLQRDLENQMMYRDYAATPHLFYKLSDYLHFCLLY